MSFNSILTSAFFQLVGGVATGTAINSIFNVAEGTQKSEVQKAMMTSGQLLLNGVASLANMDFQQRWFGNNIYVAATQVVFYFSLLGSQPTLIGKVGNMTGWLQKIVTGYLDPDMKSTGPTNPNSTFQSMRTDPTDNPDVPDPSML